MLSFHKLFLLTSLEATYFSVEEEISHLLLDEISSSQTLSRNLRNEDMKFSFCCESIFRLCFFKNTCLNASLSEVL